MPGGAALAVSARSGRKGIYMDSTTQKTKRLLLADIRTEGGTQARAMLAMDTVAEYAEAIQGGAEFPPIVVFYDGVTYWLADGFHRYHGHKQAGKTDIEVEVKQGCLRDAIFYAVSANHQHGLRRTNADKRRAVELILADKQWAEKSDHSIAEICGVSQPFVGKLREQLKTVISLAAEKRTGRDGKVRKLVTIRGKLRKPAAKPQPTPVEDDEQDEAEPDDSVYGHLPPVDYSPHTERTLDDPAAELMQSLELVKEELVRLNEAMSAEGMKRLVNETITWESLVEQGYPALSAKITEQHLRYQARMLELRDWLDGVHAAAERRVAELEVAS
ncbi:MAG: ParB/RepB/Spo0J family partition protein [Planctomycetia bacterium]|nr:ParB/RepB/Spo0J family partition protein [Planctomycetia bacterium]